MLGSVVYSPSKDEQESILARIQHYCAYQERCGHEVSLKLRQWNVPSDKIRKIIHQLKEEGFINEERYARVFTRSKFHINKWGRAKIRHELKSRTIPEHLVSKAMEEISEDDYIRTIHELIIKKMSEINSGKHLNIREKIITFVTGKGFEFDLTLKVLSELKI